MQRYYFIDENLDDLEQVSAELEGAGIAKEQLYVLTQSDGEVDRRDFNYVWSILKKDTVRSAIIGSLIGIGLADHRDTARNLKYPKKDIERLFSAFKEIGPF